MTDSKTTSMSQIEDVPQTQDHLESWRWLGWSAADWVTVRVSETTAWVTRTPYRTFTDSTYLRAALGNIWLFLPVVALVIGIVGAKQTGGTPIPPGNLEFLTLVSIGILDAFSGLVGFLPFLIWTIATGHLDSFHAIGGLFGLAIMFFGGAQTGHAFRPVGRWDNEPTKAMRFWRIAGDLFILSTVGAFVMGALAQILPYLTGYQVPIADHVNLVRVVAFAAYFLRACMEAAVIYNFRDRLSQLAWPTLPTRPKALDVVMRLFGLFLVYMALWCFLGNSLQTWLITAIYAAMPLVVKVGQRFPESTLIHRITPKSILKLVIIILVAELLVRGIMPKFTDPQMALGWTFVVLSGFVILLLVLEQFRGRGWPETWISRILGAATVILFLAVAQGYIKIV